MAVVEGRPGIVHILSRGNVSLPKARLFVRYQDYERCYWCDLNLKAFQIHDYDLI